MKKVGILAQKHLRDLRWAQEMNMMQLGMPTLLSSVPPLPRWVIYNDQKVCASEKPPKDLGYIYFYQRVVS